MAGTNHWSMSHAFLCHKMSSRNKINLCHTCNMPLTLLMFNSSTFQNGWRLGELSVGEIVVAKFEHLALNLQHLLQHESSDDLKDQGQSLELAWLRIKIILLWLMSSSCLILQIFLPKLAMLRAYVYNENREIIAWSEDTAYASKPSDLDSNTSI